MEATQRPDGRSPGEIAGEIAGLPRPRVMVSRCLLGDPVRYDGDHKQQPGLKAALESVATVVAICPEVEAGMPIPRPPVNLHVDAAGVAMIDIHGRDWTTSLITARAHRLHGHIDGLVLKSKSPSCGLSAIPRWSGHDERVVVGTGPGLFAEGALQHWPGVPATDERMLQDPLRCVDFLGRCVLSAGLRHADEDDEVVHLLRAHALSWGLQSRSLWRSVPKGRLHLSSLKRQMHLALGMQPRRRDHHWAVSQCRRVLGADLEPVMEAWLDGAAQLPEVWQGARGLADKWLEEGRPVPEPVIRYLQMHLHLWACIQRTPSAGL
ncbi:MAG: DUF523 domain-containing protein [Bradymonadia bacterium]